MTEIHNVPCPLCDAWFATQWGRRRHLREFHNSRVARVVASVIRDNFTDVDPTEVWSAEHAARLMASTQGYDVAPSLDIDAYDGTPDEDRWTYLVQISNHGLVPDTHRLQILGVYDTMGAASHALRGYIDGLLPPRSITPDRLGWILSFQRSTVRHPTSTFVGGGTRPFHL